MSYKNWQIDLLIKTTIILAFLLCLPFWLFGLYSFSILNDGEGAEYTALILGAAVFENKKPSQALEERLEEGLRLYQNNVVKKIIVSGDNRASHYNEPEVMKKWLTDRGVFEDDIIEDFAGRRTYDSCWRAKNVFEAKNVYIVTQPFHIPRSAYLCKNVGLNVKTSSSKNKSFYVKTKGLIRELPASWLSLYDTVTNKGAEIKSDDSEIKI